MTTQECAALFLLKAVDGEQQLPVDRELLMGRDANSDVVLDKGQASRKHARLKPDDEGIWVEDLGSTNGTYVNGERITEPRLLKAGDELRCGESRFHTVAREPVAEEAAADPDATLMASPSATSQNDSDPLANTEPAGPAVPDSPEESAAKPQPEAPASAADSEPAAESKAPPSWVLNNQQSVDGTAFISKDMLQDSLKSPDSSVPTKAVVAEPTLVGNSDPVMGLRFQLIGEGKQQWEIGRSPNADIMLNHESVSGSHAQVLHEGGRWKLVDLMSANGSYTNGKKCLTGYLSGGDRVRFGNVECVFLLPEEEAPPEDAANQAVEPRPGMAELARVYAAKLKALFNKEKVQGLRNYIKRIDPADLKTAAIAFGVTAAVAVVAILIIALFL